MSIKLFVYGALRDYFASPISLDIPSKSCIIGDIIAILLKEDPSAEAVFGQCKIVLNKSFVRQDASVKDRDVILLFPPSSGG